MGSNLYGIKEFLYLVIEKALYFMDNTTSLGSKIKYFLMFVPFRMYLIFFVFCCIIAKFWLAHQFPLKNTLLIVIMAMLFAVITLFVFVLITLLFISVLIPYILFRMDKSLGKTSVSFNTIFKDENRQGNVMAQMKISPLFQPFFGFLKYRIVYDGNQLSPKFSAVDAKRSTKFFDEQKEGIYNWPLPEIREYKIEKLIVYFEDLFQFFSFASVLPINREFFTKPPKKELENLEMSPKKTEEENTRIEELRRVEGEYLNYKNFENNDDVRRIVWKIYAKNKELVVRTPEILDPFASHIYLYASYQDDLGASSQNIIARRGLNYFKTSIWATYLRLKKQGFEVRFISDQLQKTFNSDSEETKVEHLISTSNWHAAKGLNEYVNVKDASVVCVSSLTNAEDLTQLLTILGNDATIVNVRLSNAFNRQGVVKWVRWIFLQEEKDPDNNYLMQWNLSAAKRKMLINEKAISKILEGSGKRVIQI